MQPLKAKAAIMELGVHQNRLAARLRVTENKLSGWLTGTVQAPHLALEIIVKLARRIAAEDEEATRRVDASEESLAAREKIR